MKHLAKVAQGAARENPELAQKFVLRPENMPYLEFQAMARAMLAEAQANKELLVKYGLAETVLAGMDRNVKQFDLNIEQSTEARRGHVGASAELDAIGEQIVHLVNVMDGLNRDRFADTPEVLAEWTSARNVFGPPFRLSAFPPFRLSAFPPFRRFTYRSVPSRISAAVLCLGPLRRMLVSAAPP